MLTTSNHIVLVILTFLLVSRGFSQDKFLKNQEILHTVVKGQTLYSIAKNYQLDVDDVVAYNEGGVLIDAAISPTQVIRIPVLADENDKLDMVLSKLKRKPKIHQVRSKETVFGLSKRYQIDVDSLKKWNNITAENINIDQDLIVGWEYSTMSTENTTSPTTKPVEKKPRAPQTSSQRSVNKQDMLHQKYLTAKEGKVFKSMKGVANWFETENRMMASNYYGMLNGVAVGTIVEVQNPQNKKKVYVKIIGKLPSTAENAGVMIKLTPVAKSLLGENSSKLHVAINYYH